MSAILLETTDEKFVISLDKKFFDKQQIFDLLERLRFESLIQKADFDDTIDDISEDIKAHWWQKNKDRFIKTDTTP